MGAGLTVADVVVVGSVNLDRVQTVARLPAPGETVHGTSFALHHGGKGANQAVAAARLGAAVRFVGRVGDDDAGPRLRAALADDGIDVGPLRTVPGPTGFATILVSATGENVIVIEAGANAALRAEDLDPADLAGARLALFQLEVPLATVVRGLELARAAGATTILNAAPPDGAERVPPELVDVLVVNDAEAAYLVGVGAGDAERGHGAGARAAPRVDDGARDEPADPRALVAALARRYRSVVLTLGADGVTWSHEGRTGSRPAWEVEAKDTTGAGDTFTGALAARLAAGDPWERAAEVAIAAAALCVTRPGAQAAIPRLAEVEAWMRGVTG